MYGDFYARWALCFLAGCGVLAVAFAASACNGMRPAATDPAAAAWAALVGVGEGGEGAIVKSMAGADADLGGCGMDDAAAGAAVLVFFGGDCC